jgi:hypothetical protein
MNFDWSLILAPALQVLVPLLTTALTSYVIVLVRGAWQNFKNSQPKLVDEILLAAQFAVPAIEQLKAAGVIPTNEQAKAEAEKLMETYLLSKGIKVDLAPWIDLISASIEKTVIENKAATTVTVSSPSSSVSTTGTVPVSTDPSVAVG